MAKSVDLVYLDALDQRIAAHTGLKDTVSKGGAEFLLLNSGKEIRMDRIISLDGIPLSGHS